MQARILDVDTALLTPHTVVRRFRENDGEAFYELLRENHARLIDPLPELLREVNDKDQGEFFVRRKIAGWLVQEEFCFGIWEHESAQLIGMIRLFNLDWRIPMAEVVYFIDHAFAGQGLMTEALTEVVNFAFDQLKLEKLHLRTAMENYAAQRLARKCGFRREGDLREEFRKPAGELVDAMLFGLTRSQYEKL